MPKALVGNRPALANAIRVEMLATCKSHLEAKAFKRE